MNTEAGDDNICTVRMSDDLHVTVLFLVSNV